MTIYLLGLYHDFQTEPCAEFENYVRNVCVQTRIQSVAEEMNSDALREANADQSTVAKVANTLGLPHAYCDPNEQQRKGHDILGERELKHLKWWDDLSDDEASALKAIHTKKREEYWIEKLNPIFSDPMLFVCGVDHLSSFSGILRGDGFNVVVLDKQWTDIEQIGAR